RHGRVRLFALYQTKSLEESRFIFKGNKLPEVARWSKPHPVRGRRSSGLQHNHPVDIPKRSHLPREEIRISFSSGTLLKHWSDPVTKNRCGENRERHRRARDWRKPSRHSWKRSADTAPVPFG